MNKRLLPIILSLIVVFSFGSGLTYADISSDFVNPPLEYKTRPLWFWQGTLSTTGINDILQNSRDQSGYGGFVGDTCNDQMSSVKIQ